MRLSRSIPVLAWLLAAVPCGALALPAQVEQRKPIVIDNPREPVPPPGRRWMVSFHEELTVGVAEGDENLMFGESISVTADDRGLIYVLDWDRKRIQKFGPDGAFIASLGRPGQGPGEFQNIWDMRFDGDGNMYATDIVNKRVTFFGPDGKYLKAVALPPDVGPVEFLPGGTALARRNTRDEQMNFQILAGIFDEDWTLVTELHRDRLDLPRENPSDRARFMAGIMNRTAFKPVFHSAVSPDGLIYAGYAASYEIRVHDAAGPCLRVIRKDDPARPVDARHKDFDFERRVAPFVKQSAPELVGEVRKFLTYPRALPVYSGFALMDGGRLFVIQDALPDGSTIDLFDTEGVYVGRFTTELDLSSIVFRGKKAYLAAEEDGYKFAKRYAWELKNY